MGPPGPAGTKGDKGDSAVNLRMVRVTAITAACSNDEVIVSAVCAGRFSRQLLVTSANTARCGPDIRVNDSVITLLCAKP